MTLTLLHYVLFADDKAPPVLSKKPVLPPASKKPQLRNPAPTVTPTVTPVIAPKKGGNEVADSPEQRLNDLVDGTASSKIKITSNQSAGEFVWVIAWWWKQRCWKKGEGSRLVLK